MKVMTVLGTRPELIKLSCVIPVLDSVFQHVLVHTGQNYSEELSGQFFRELGLRGADYQLKLAAPRAADAIGQIISGCDRVLEAERPDALLVLGDTNTGLCVIAAKRRRVPVFHMEAGNRCYDDRVPEEVNRRIIDHTSDINMPYSEHARQCLLSEGLRPDRVIVTGSPMREVLSNCETRIAASDAVYRCGLTPGGYVLASLHREENVDSRVRLGRLLEALGRVADAFHVRVVLSMHPRTSNRIAEGGLALPSGVEAVPAFGFLDYVALQRSALCTVSDSGTISEEASLLRTPAVTVRETHERPEAMDEGTVIMTGLSTEGIVSSVALAVQQQREYGPSRPVRDYDVPQVSWKVAKIIMSYTDYVRRNVWHESAEFDVDSKEGA